MSDRAISAAATPAISLVMAPPLAVSGLWASGHHRLEAAGYMLAGVIGLAIGPALFVALDEAVVVRWSNAIFDLLSLK